MVELVERMLDPSTGSGQALPKQLPTHFGTLVRETWGWT